MRKLSLILITVLSFGCSQNEYKIEKGKVGKLFKENLVKQLDSIYKNDSIVRRIGEGDYMFSGDDKYLIFNNKKGEAQLLFDILKEQKLSNKIFNNRIKICDLNFITLISFRPMLIKCMSFIRTSWA